MSDLNAGQIQTTENEDGGHFYNETQIDFASPSTWDAFTGENGHTFSETHMASADSFPLDDQASGDHVAGETHTAVVPGSLDWLHVNMGHYARQYLDAQRVRIALANRDRGLRELFGEQAEPYQAASRGVGPTQPIDPLVLILKAEKQLAARLERLVRQHFMSDWVRDTRGLGPLGFALLVGIVTTKQNRAAIGGFATVSKLWRYLGMDVQNGAAPNRKRGAKLGYSPQGRVLCHQIGDAIVRIGAGGPYRADYDRKKADYLGRERSGPSACPFGQTHEDKNKKVIPCGLAHAHNAAMRYAVKRLLRDLWVEWHQHI